MSATHAAEMFQSSIMSWSSNIMALGTVLSIQRSISGCQASWYSQVYSSKSATIPGGGPSLPRVRAILAAVRGEESSA